MSRTSLALVPGMLVVAGMMAGVWVLYALAAFLGQRALLYPAPRATEVRAPRGVASVMLPIAGATIEAWLMRPVPDRGERAPLVIFAHGNAELIDYWPGEFNELRAAGMAVLLVEYPGYGRSTGSPSQQSLTDAMLASYDWAKVVPGIDSTRIVAYGRSLGGGSILLWVGKTRHEQASTQFGSLGKNPHRHRGFRRHQRGWLATRPGDAAHGRPRVR